MLLLRNLAPWLLLACLAQQVSVSNGARDGRGRKGKGGGGKPEQPPTPAPDRAEKGATKGKFTTKDKMQCKWAARGEDTVTLAVNCMDPAAAVTGGASPFTCYYTARPTTCPGFGTNPAGYWKQVARALKKLQRKLCKDERAQVKAGMCKRAPQDAHFKLDIGSREESRPAPPRTTAKATTASPRTTAKATTASPRTTAKATTAPAATGTTRPTGSACTDQRKLADEYCSSSWASLCTFFFSMVQSGDC